MGNFLTSCVVGLLLAGFHSSVLWAAANQDPNYRALRDASLTTSYQVDNVTVTKDAGVFTFLSGTLSFAAPVLGRHPVAVFVGEGSFELEPRQRHEIRNLLLLTEQERVHDKFTRALFYVSDTSFATVLGGGEQVAVPEAASKTLDEWRRRLRRRTDEPRSMMESLVSGSGIENLDAELLGDLYRSQPEGIFNAYFEGEEFEQLRFHYRPAGVLTGLPAPEEVALLSVDPLDAAEGILYLAHSLDEQTSPHGGADEDKRSVDASHYDLDVRINGERLAVEAAVSVSARADQLRLLRFGLLPNLRVEEVQLEGAPIDFIQEDKDADSAFYVIFPEALAQGDEATLNIRYSGDKVLDDAGGGNYSVGARTSWYPSLNAFNDRATFSLTFRAPRKMKIVAVGKRLSEEREGDLTVSRWASEVPLTVAGFNYGRFKQKDSTDDVTGYELEGFATQSLPSSLFGAQAIGGMSPVRLMDNALVDALNSIRIFTHWFGELPYGRLAITQQPELNFGQSWPTLVYLPIIAFFDSTQRWQLFGGIIPELTNFVDEVTPHEVAHQWWGHLVSWSSFHDQWISEGFSEFSASLYLETTGQEDRYLEFWEDHRKTIVEKGRLGIAPNDVGSIWMGLRLQTNRTPGVYSQLVYPKGAFIPQMLRWMMHDTQEGDARFRAMMQDFIAEFRNQPASTQGFKRVAERHMTPELDLDRNGRLDWFFNQYVYGTALPSYKLEYRLEPEPDGKVLLTGRVTQSGVSDNFKMLVPLYLEFEEEGILPFGKSSLVGNSTTPDFKLRLPKQPRRVLINARGELLARKVEIEGGK